jgi:hypothetical protein
MGSWRKLHEEQTNDEMGGACSTLEKYKRVAREGK